MKVPTQLSPEMQAALDLAKEQAGKLFRHESAFWGPEKFDPETTSFAKLFSTQTVKGLVARKRLRWTEYSQGTGGKFPVQAEVVEAAT